MKEMISIIAPVFNERENLQPFLMALFNVLEQIGENYEVVIVDDGSTDGSSEYLIEAARSKPRLKLIQFRRNFGQTAAIAAGFDFATGELLVAIDADMQNDPQDIPAILAKLREGFDVVSCWRSDRKDAWLTRRIPSRLANLLISRISGVRLHDYGCTLKGYRREILGHIRLYGEMHRFIPIYASWAGAKVTEIPVQPPSSSERLEQIRIEPHLQGHTRFDHRQDARQLFNQADVLLRWCRTPGMRRRDLFCRVDAGRQVHQSNQGAPESASLAVGVSIHRRGPVHSDGSGRRAYYPHLL